MRFPSLPERFGEPETLLARIVFAYIDNLQYKRFLFLLAMFVPLHSTQTRLLGASSQTHKSLTSFVCCAPGGHYNSYREQGRSAPTEIQRLRILNLDD
jgi:hypothetical protein